MYNCQQCGATVTGGQQTIVAQGPAVYPYRRGVHRKVVIEKGRKTEKWTDDPGGVGRAITSEAHVCHECMRQYQLKVLMAKEQEQNKAQIHI